MPDKLTDKEIVNDAKQVTMALEYCVEGDCEKCPYDEQTACNEYLKLDAVKVIDRLQAENEKLQIVKKHIDTLIHRGVEYPTAETYERAFKKALEQLYDNTNAKAEAYKECIDMVKKKGVKVGVDEICIFEGTLNNILKELVGEDNASKN